MTLRLRPDETRLYVSSVSNACEDCGHHGNLAASDTVGVFARANGPRIRCVDDTRCAQRQRPAVRPVGGVS